MGKITGRFRQARLDYQSRQGRTVTIEEVAEGIGITRQSLTEIERGRALPRYTVLAALCKLYGLQPGDLLMYEDRRTRLLAGAQPSTSSRAGNETTRVAPTIPIARS